MLLRMAVKAVKKAVKAFKEKTERTAAPMDILTALQSVMIVGSLC